MYPKLGYSFTRLVLFGFACATAPSAALGEAAVAVDDGQQCAIVTRTFSPTVSEWTAPFGSTIKVVRCDATHLAGLCKDGRTAVPMGVTWFETNRRSFACVLEYTCDDTCLPDAESGWVDLAPMIGIGVGADLTYFLPPFTIEVATATGGETGTQYANVPPAEPPDTATTDSIFQPDVAE